MFWLWRSLYHPWWRHQMETFSALLAICAGNSPVPSEFPAQMPVTRSFDVFFDLRRNKRLRKQSWGWWFETLSRPVWRHCNVDQTNMMGYGYASCETTTHESIYYYINCVLRLWITSWQLGSSVCILKEVALESIMQISPEQDASIYNHTKYHIWIYPVSYFSPRALSKVHTPNSYR